MINFQLSLISSSLSTFTCLVEDTEDISKRGFFTGYVSNTMVFDIAARSAVMV